MAINAGRLVVLLSANDAQFRKAVRGADRQTATLARTLRRTQRDLGRFSREALRQVRTFTLWAGGIAAVGGAFTTYRIVDRTVRWGRALTDLSAKTNIQIEQLARYEAALQGTGVEIAEFADVLNTLAERLIEFQRGESTAIDAFRQLGLASELASGQIRTQEEALNALARQYQAIARIDPTLATASLSELVGGGAALTLEPLIRRFGGDLAGAAGRISQETGGVISAEEIRALDEISENVRLTTVAVQNGFRRMVIAFAPIINQVSAAIREEVGNLATRLAESDFLGNIVANLDEIVATFRVAIRVIPEFVIEQFQRMFDILGTTLRLAASTLVIAAFGFLGGAIRLLASGIINIVNIIIPGLRVATQVLLGAVLRVGGLIAPLFFEVVRDGLAFVFDTISDTIAGVADAIDLGDDLTTRLQSGIQEELANSANRASDGLDDVASVADELTNTLRGVRRSIQNDVSDTIVTIFTRLQRRVDDLRVGNQLTGRGATDLQAAQVDFLRTLVADFDDPMAKLESSITRLNDTIDSLEARILALAAEIGEFNQNFPNLATPTPSIPDPNASNIPEVNALEDIEDLEVEGNSRLRQIWDAVRRGFGELIGVTEANAQVRPFDFPLGVLDPDRERPTTLVLPPDPVVDFRERNRPAPQAVPNVDRQLREYAAIVNDLVTAQASLDETLTQRDRLQGIIDVITNLAPPTTEEEQRFLNEVIEGLRQLELRFQRQYEGFRIRLQFDSIGSQRVFNRGIADLADSLDQGLDRQLEDLLSFGEGDIFNNVIRQFDDAFNDERLSRLREIADLNLELVEAQRLVGREDGAADRVRELRAQIQQAQVGLDQFTQSWYNNAEAREVWARQHSTLQRQLDQLTELGQAVEGAFTTAFEQVIFEGQKLGDAFKALVQTIIQEIIRIAIIGPIVSQIGSFFSFGAGAGTGVPGFATGGRYPGGLALVGERGPELIDFNRPGNIYSNAQLRGAIGGGGGGNVYNHFQIASTDGPGTRAAIAEAIPGIVAAAKGEVQRDISNRNSAIAQQIRNRASEA